MRLPDVLDHEDLPLAELSALRIDGVVFALGDGYRPVDSPDDVRGRAQSLRRTLDAGRIGYRETAAWVLGGLDRLPRPIPFCVHAGRSKGIDPRHGLVLSEAILAPDELLDIDDVLVTSPLRTVVDLLRFPDYPASTETAVHELMRRYSVTPTDVITRLADRRFQRERLRAHRRLADLPESPTIAPQPAETR